MTNELLRPLNDKAYSDVSRETVDGRSVLNALGFTVTRAGRKTWLVERRMTRRAIDDMAKALTSEGA